MGERLKGAHVLVVEDEPIFSWEVTGLIEADGADVVGPASSIGEAIACLSRRQPDAAVLDWRLLDGVAHPLAVALEQRGIPFAFHTADEDTVRNLWPLRPILPTR